MIKKKNFKELSLFSSRKFGQPTNLPSSEFAIEFLLDQISQLELKNVYLLVGQTAVHVPVVYAETKALTLCLWMDELVDKLHRFG